MRSASWTAKLLAPTRRTNTLKNADVKKKKPVVRKKTQCITNNEAVRLDPGEILGKNVSVPTPRPKPPTPPKFIINLTDEKEGATLFDHVPSIFETWWYHPKLENLLESIE